MFRKYLVNCFLLTVPVMVWDLVLTDRLPKAFQPEIFWKDIPAWLTYGENILRTIVFLLAFLMPLSIVSRTQKTGLGIYIAGILLYFASWIALIWFPACTWSESIAGFLAPAFTPLLWLTGIGLVGESFYFGLPYRRWMFIGISVLFLLFHNLHAILIFNRLH